VPDAKVEVTIRKYGNVSAASIPIALDEWNSACALTHQELFTRVRPDLPGLIAWIQARFHARIYEDAYSPFCLIAGNNGDADRIHEHLDEYCGRVPGFEGVGMMPGVFLAFREMRRALVRFGLLVFAIGLLLFLILIQQALQDGLITSFVGGIRNQSAPVLVYSVDGQRTLQGSVIAPPLEQQIRAVAGVAQAGRIGQSTFTARVDGSTKDSDAAIFGYEHAGVGVQVHAVAQVARDFLSVDAEPRPRPGGRRVSHGEQRRESEREEREPDAPRGSTHDLPPVSARTIHEAALLACGS